MPPLHLPTVSDFIYWVGMAAVAASAVSGALESGLKRMDIVGVSVVAVATALGGGTVRDLLLNRPVFWIANQAYLHAAFGAALTTFFLARAVRLPPRLFLIPDAVGLALFTISGTQIALDLQVSGLAAVLMGVVTAAFGGVLRDIFCNSIPLIFLPGQLYASAAFAGAVTCVGLQMTGIEHVNAGWVGMAVVFGLRIAGLYLKTGAPVFKDRQDRR